MKIIINLFIALLISFAGFAQKGKSTNVQIPANTTHAIYTCPDHPDMISDQRGKCPRCNMDMTVSEKEVMKLEQMHIYTCNMHPNIKSLKPNDCPKCGMRFVEDTSFVPKLRRKGN